MTTAQEVKNEMAELFADPGFFEQDESEAANWIFRLIKPLIKQVAQDALNRAANNARVIEDWHRGRLHGASVNKFSIVSTEIIIP